MTFIREPGYADIFAWHRHDTDGVFEDVISVPEGSEDAVYVVVRRVINGQTKRYIERFAKRYTSQALDIKRNAFFVDCGGTYDGLNTGSTTLTVTADTGLTVTTSQILTASADVFSSGDVGNVFEITIGTSTIRFTVLEYTDARHVKVQANKNVGFAGTPTTSWSRCVDEVAGLTWLVGKEVSILADGNVHPARTVNSAGVVSLDRQYSVVHVGLPYVSQLKSLTIDIQGNETMVDKHKIVSKVSMQVESSRGIWAGPDEQHLREYKQRALENYNEPTALTTGLVEIQTISQWDKNGQIVIEQQDPLPITVLSVVPQITVATR